MEGVILVFAALFIIALYCKIIDYRDSKQSHEA